MLLLKPICVVRDHHVLKHHRFNRPFYQIIFTRVALTLIIINKSQYSSYELFQFIFMISMMIETADKLNHLTCFLIIFLPIYPTGAILLNYSLFIFFKYSKQHHLSSHTHRINYKQISKNFTNSTNKTLNARLKIHT